MTERMEGMRRSEREVREQDEMLRLLYACPVMHLGLDDGGMPYVVPLSFGWEMAEGKLTLYFHSAKEGRKNRLIGASAPCFVTMTGPSAIEKGKEACGWSASFSSVMAEGLVYPLTDAAEKEAALDIIMRRYGFEGKPAYDGAILMRTAVYRIDAAKLSAKRKD